MSTGMIVLALLGSMMVGVLFAILLDTFYVRRWHEAVQADRQQLAQTLHKRTRALRRAEAKYTHLQAQTTAYQREVERLEAGRVALETRLETAVVRTTALKAELKQFDDEMDALRDEKVELARQLTVAQIEMQYLQEEVDESEQQLAAFAELAAEKQQLAAKLELITAERDERKAKVDELLHQIAETERLRTTLKKTEAKLETTRSKLGNMQTALGRAKTQIKHTGKSQLQLLKGIGPATERKFKAAGIVTIADLAEETPERLLEILNLKSTSRPKTEAWISEAQQLAPTFGADH